MRSLLLKAAATALTLLAALGAAVHVGGHLKSAAAPLQPAVVGASAVATTRDGKLSLSPSIRSADVQAVTSTYAS
jgi:hypothetical protein